MSTVSELEDQLKEWRDQLETINEQLALNPNNAEFIELKTVVESGIQEYEVELATLQPKAAPPTPPPAAETPKWSVENHPAYQGTGRKPPTQQSADEPEPVHNYQVNEKVQARYKGKFYSARIISKFGSSKDPKFTIKFDGWPETPTLGLEALKPLAAPAAPQQTKRKAEDDAFEMPSSTHTYSAAPNVNAELAQARKEPSKVSDGPPKAAKAAKKLKNNKTYEKSANDWKAFNSKMSGKGKMGKKESMFRTGDGVNARVGFTGSGKPMRIDPTRQKHRYEQVEQDEDV